MDSDRSAPAVAQNGEVFYALQGNDVIERQLNGEQILVPARDVLHIKLHSNKRYPRPLVGETPLAAAFGDIASYEAMRSQHDQFFRNQARPSAVLQTDLNLDATQVQMLRDRWNDQSKGLASGGTPILTHGLRVQPWSTTAGKELQVAELMKLSVEQVALVFRVPLQILGIGGAPLGSTEALMRFWLASGLGFALSHVELAFDKLFGLAGQPTEYVEFDTSALLRSDYKDRIEALARGVQTGIYAANEARNEIGLDSVPYGDEPRTQAQNVPLSAISSIPTATTAAVPPSAPAVRSYDRAVRRDMRALMSRQWQKQENVRWK